MKGKKKHILGLLGLFLVAAITAFAVMMPQQGTSATLPPQSITDEVSVRVVGSKPMVRFTSPANDTRFTQPNQTLTFDYENVTDATVTIEYTDANGNSRTYNLEPVEGADYAPGTKTYQLNLDGDQNYNFGYGDYKVTVKGSGYGNDNITEDVIVFHYSRFNGSIQGTGSDSGTGDRLDSPLTGGLIIDPGVDPNDSTIGHVGICVRHSNGTPVKGMCPINIEAPFDALPLEFDEMPTDRYTVEFQAYDKDGNPIGAPQIYRFYYKIDESKIAATPDTGAAFGSLNISRQDYLLTGLIVFVAAAVLGIVFVVRRKETAKRKKR